MQYVQPIHVRVCTQEKRQPRSQRNAQLPAPALRRPVGRFRAGLRRYGAYLQPIVYGVCGTVIFRRWAAMAFRILPRTLQRPAALGDRLQNDRCRLVRPSILE